MDGGVEGGVGSGLEEEQPRPGRGGVEESGRGGVVGVIASRSPSPSPPSGVEGTPGKVKVDSSEHVQLAKGGNWAERGWMPVIPSALLYESCSFGTIVEGTTKHIIKILRETDSRAL